MIKHRTLRHIAVCGISLPTFAVCPSVAKPTVYMPSQVAARIFGGRAPGQHEQADQRPTAAEFAATSNAA